MRATHLHRRFTRHRRDGRADPGRRPRTVDGPDGLLSDNLIEADIVTADGVQRTVNAQSHPDLFWALRGGGGNFGVVTSLTYRLHPAEPTLAGVVAHPASRAREVLRFYREFTADAPDALAVFALFVTAPGGQPAVALLACHTGDLQEGERLLAPLRRTGAPVLDTIQPTPYPALLGFTDGKHPAGIRSVCSARGLHELTDEAIDVLAEFGATPTSPHTDVVLLRQHGAASRLAPDATAYGLRGVPYHLMMVTAWHDGPDDPHVQWAERFRAAMGAVDPHVAAPGYLNVEQERDDAQTQQAYGDNYARLRAIKARWDPQNLFRHNHNVRP